jgi:hypothetical protein
LRPKRIWDSWGASHHSDAAADDGVHRAWLRALIVAPFIHGLTLSALAATSCAEPDLDFLMALLAGSDFEGVREPFAPLTRHAKEVLAYFSFVNVIAAGAGRLLHKQVRTRRLDQKFELLRFPNDWHYTLSGDLLLNRPSAVLVDITIEFDSATYIYTGILTKWKINSSGKLERLHLKGAARRELDSANYEAFGGDEFIAWCDEIKTLNVRYIVVQQTSSQPA